MKTREEERRERANDYAEEMTHKGTSSECEWVATRDDFLAGARWADEHPKNPWRDARKELPKGGDKIICSFIYDGKRGFGFSKIRDAGGYPIIKGVLYFGVTSCDYWMPLPELPK